MGVRSCAERIFLSGQPAAVGRIGRSGCQFGDDRLGRGREHVAHIDQLVLRDHVAHALLLLSAHVRTEARVFQRGRSWPVVAVPAEARWFGRIAPRVRRQQQKPRSLGRHPLRLERGFDALDDGHLLIQRLVVRPGRHAQIEHVPQKHVALFEHTQLGVLHVATGRGRGEHRCPYERPVLAHEVGQERPRPHVEALPDIAFVRHVRPGPGDLHAHVRQLRMIRVQHGLPDGLVPRHLQQWTAHEVLHDRVDRQLEEEPKAVLHAAVCFPRQAHRSAMVRPQLLGNVHRRIDLQGLLLLLLHRVRASVDLHRALPTLQPTVRWLAELAQGLTAKPIEEELQHRGRVGPFVDRVDHHRDRELVRCTARPGEREQELTETHVHELHEVQEGVVAEGRVDHGHHLRCGRLAIRSARCVGLEAGCDRPTRARCVAGLCCRPVPRDQRLGLGEAQDAVGRHRATFHLQVQSLVIPAVLGELSEHAGEQALGALLLVQPRQPALERAVGVVVPLHHVASRFAPAMHPSRLGLDALRQRVVVERTGAGHTRARLDVGPVIIGRLRLVYDVRWLDVQPDRPRQVDRDEPDDEPVLVEGTHEHFVEVGLAVAHHVVRVQHPSLVVVRLAIVDVVQVGLEGGLVVPGVEHPL
eukprot:4803188-Pleurochrysis_carterae.AAC.1